MNVVISITVVEQRVPARKTSKESKFLKSIEEKRSSERKIERQKEVPLLVILRKIPQDKRIGVKKSRILLRRKERLFMEE